MRASASRVRRRSDPTQMRTAAGVRFVMAGAAAPKPKPGTPSKGQGLNQPKAIFWGWAALVVVAGYGYFTVKSNNTAKKREFMIQQGQQLQQQKNAATGQDEQAAASSTPVLMSSSNQEKYAQSPLQSLAAAFTRQTIQRSRQSGEAGSSRVDSADSQ